MISVLAPLNSTMIAVALPSLIDDFDASVSAGSWLVTAYLIVMASVQPLAGKLGDSMGRRNLIIGAMIAFAAVSVGASIAPNIWTVLIFRVGQALTISIALSNGFAMLRQVVPPGRRGKTFGIVEASTGLSAAAGPLVGGLLVTALSWHAIFLVNLPFAGAGLLLAWQSLPHDSRKGELKGFDLMGGILLPVSLVAIAGFFLLVARGSGPWLYIPAGLGAVALAVVLVTAELRHPDPVFQPRFFKIRGFAAPSAAVGTSNLAMYSLLLTVPILLVARGGYSELEIGLILTSLSVGMALLTPLGGRLTDQFGRRHPVMVGLTLMALGTITPAVSGSGIGVLPLVVSLGLVGVGIGISSSGMRVSAVESVPLKSAGAGAGVYSTSRYFGSIVGSAILAGLIGVDKSNTDGIDRVFIMVGVAAFAAVATTFFMVSRPWVDDEAQ